ncbi:MAG: (d)CMP kinase, partial [Burkholderiales bacterium]|nr:(d)CMP kinase [Burkholderiales bacterium]
SETYLNGKNVGKRIRSLDVSRSVSPVSVIPRVREFVDNELRKWGEKKGVVIDGRDIGTAVFPQAELKIFMTAPAHVRARRRLDEMKAKGEEATFEEVLDNVLSRDHLDSTREVHPLTRASDAVLLDNGNMSVEEQMEWFKKIMEERWGIRLK